VESTIEWAPDGRRLWTAMLGFRPVYAIELGGERPLPSNDALNPFFSPGLEAVLWGSTPIAAERDVAVSTRGDSLTLLDTKTGRVLWSRVRLGREGTLFQTVDGWFDASFDDLTELEVFRYGDRDEGTPLASLAVQLFDPKRVRAQRAGIELAAMTW
jgi:hypothetical protein